MNDLELNTLQTQREKQSGLTIYRPVLNIPENFSEFLTESIVDAGFTKNIIKIVSSNLLKIEIIGSGELRRIQEASGIINSSEVNNELAEYLNDFTPDSYDNVLEDIPTFPLRYYPRKSKSDSLVLSAATDNLLVKNERLLTQQIINEKYGIRKKTSDTWSDTEYRTNLNIAWLNNNRIYRQTIVPELQNFLNSFLINFFPDYLYLGQATIDNIDNISEQIT